MGCGQAHLWEDKMELTRQAYTDSTLHKFGNKLGKLLIRLCKGPHHPTFITSLCDTEALVQSLPQEVNKVVLKFYANDPIDKHIAQRFLNKVHLPKVDPHHALNAPKSLTEFFNYTTPSSKQSSCPDGFSQASFIKHSQDLVKPTLFQVYNEIWSGVPTYPLWNQATNETFVKEM